MKRVLIVSDGFFHPPWRGRRALRRSLAKLPGIAFRHTRSMDDLPRDLGEYAALVIYVHHKRMTGEALEKLERFTAQGGGVLGVHTATASFRQQDKYFEILGGRFVGHGAVRPFEVKPVSDDRPFTGLPAFTVTDELYLHELQPGIQAHFTAREGDEDIPVVWTYQYGQGRVCYATPGHTTATLQHPLYQELLRRGLAWVVGGP